MQLISNDWVRVSWKNDRLPPKFDVFNSGFDCHKQVAKKTVMENSLQFFFTMFWCSDSTHTRMSIKFASPHMYPGAMHPRQWGIASCKYRRMESVHDYNVRSITCDLAISRHSSRTTNQCTGGSRHLHEPRTANQLSRKGSTLSHHLALVIWHL